VGTSPRPFVFTLMPFDAEFEDVYRLGIRPACEAAGAYCERVDDQIFQESILQRIYNQIAKADLVIADMTGRNPNVFYETGYAHALGKRVILLTRDVNDIPFDLKHYPHLVYGGRITVLLGELEKRVLWHLQNPPVDAKLLVAEVLEFYIFDQKIIDGATVTLEDFPDDDVYEVEIAIHNPSNLVYRGPGQDLALIAPNGLEVGGPGPYGEEDPFRIKLPDGRILHTFRSFDHHILPDAWDAVSLRFGLDAESELWAHPVIPIVVRLFTETGPRDLRVNLVLSRAQKLPKDEALA
jgi:hypothetical protein